MNSPNTDIIIYSGENISAFGAGCSQVFEVFDPRLRDIAATIQLVPDYLPMRSR